MFAPTQATDVTSAATAVLGVDSSVLDGKPSSHSVSGGFASTSPGSCDIKSLKAGSFVVCCKRQGAPQPTLSLLERLRARKFVTAQAQSETPSSDSDMAGRILRVLRVGESSIECETFGGERRVFKVPFDQLGPTKDEYIRDAGPLEQNWFATWCKQALGTKRGREDDSPSINFTKNLVVRVTNEKSPLFTQKFKIVDLIRRESRLSLQSVELGQSALESVPYADVDTVIPRAGERGMILNGHFVGEIVVVERRERDSITNEVVAIVMIAGETFRFKGSDICLVFSQHL